MTDKRTERMAEVITAYSTELETGELALIQTEPAGFVLCREVFRRAIERGAHPYVRTLYAELEEIQLSRASDEQLAYVSDMDKVEIEKIDARVVIRAPENTRYLAGVSADRLSLQRRSRQQLFNRMLERKGRGELKTCLTQFPTAASAQEAGMSLSDHESFVFRACFVDKPDPVAEWRRLSEEQQRHVDILGRARDIRIEGVDTELRLSVAGRRWINSDGKANFPSGEVFTGPVEGSANGRISFDVPTSYSGHEVEGVRLEFKSGKVTAAQAARGEGFLQGMLKTDAGSSSLGEFAFGLNYGIDRPTRNILFDEKIGGTIHLAVGSGYPETGSVNRSSIHWDMIKDMKQGRVFADGTLIYENGRFIV